MQKFNAKRTCVKKRHRCVFVCFVLLPDPAVPGQNAQKQGGKFGGRKKEKFKQSI